MRLHPPPDLGTAVAMELIIPHSKQSLRLEGTVMRVSTGRQVAVQFAHLTPAQRDTLEDYVGSPDSEVATSGWIKE